jgi:isopenicillin N synthase-like dioxygenase
MDVWGNTLHKAVLGLAEMIAVGFGLPKKTFVDMAQYGPHLLAPTASDLNKFGAVGTVLAGFHYDLNFLTIHGKSRYPGLNIWPRNESEKLAVRVPDGCLLVQAGKQLEWLTGGVVQAGYHEVVVNEATKRVIDNKTNDRPLWRISSTFFLHIASDNVLRPLEGVFDTEEAKAKYTHIHTGDQVRKELGLIALLEK